MPSFPTVSPAVWTPVIWAIIAVTGLIGAVALVSPRVFAKMSAKTSRWIDSNKILAVLDTRIDIDPYVLPFSRWLGAAAIASVSLLALVIWKYG